MSSSHGLSTSYHQAQGHTVLRTLWSTILFMGKILVEALHPSLSCSLFPYEHDALLGALLYTSINISYKMFLQI